MKFYGKSPVRISLCNSGDTDYYIKEMGWSNLINATLHSGWYACAVETKNQDFIDYSYKNGFSKTGRNFSWSSEKHCLRKILPDLKNS